MLIYLYIYYTYPNAVHSYTVYLSRVEGIRGVLMRTRAVCRRVFHASRTFLTNVQNSTIYRASIHFYDGKKNGKLRIDQTAVTENWRKCSTLVWFNRISRRKKYGYSESEHLLDNYNNSEIFSIRYDT